MRIREATKDDFAEIARLPDHQQLAALGDWDQAVRTAPVKVTVLNPGEKANF